MRALEAAVAQGHAMATVPGYAEKRQRALDGPPTRTGPNIEGWQRLAAMFPDRVQHGGERLVH